MRVSAVLAPRPGVAGWMGLTAFALWMVVWVPAAHAGTWSRLPAAAARLQVDAGDSGAERVIEEAEAAVLGEAAAGRLAAVASLMEVYESLVLALDDGDRRLRTLERRAANVLLAYGDRLRTVDVSRAGTTWTLAGGFDPENAAMDRLREVLLPPADPEGGQVWTAAVDGAELVYLPSMLIRMGCTENDRRCRDNEIYFRWVEVPGLWIDRTETTNRRYRRCVEAEACSRPADMSRYEDPARADEPVVGVSWRQARMFAHWAGRRLPSEAAWERAARGKETTWKFPWGNSRRLDLANVWVETRRQGNGPVQTGVFPPTGWGVVDLAGNLWEWCEDRYQPGLKQVPADGSAVQSGWGRVVRGGSWRRGIDLARVSTRSWFEESYSADDVGFRTVLDAGSAVGRAELLARAERAFKLRVQPGEELSGAAVTAEDRRYLDRRTITWKVLEGRPWDATPQAIALLRREGDDTVALSLLDRVESGLTDYARAGKLKILEKLHQAYLPAAGDDRRLVRRLRGFDEHLVDALRSAGQELSRSGEDRSAAALLTLALAIAPGESELERVLAGLHPAPGETRSWAQDGKEMVWIPTGSFGLGASPGDHNAGLDELPTIEVQVRGFWIDRTEVTNAEYRRCVEAGACAPLQRTDLYDDPSRTAYPVLGVSWFQARSYVEWAGKRLPSEAEWERAARAGATTRFPWGTRWDPAAGNAIGTDDGDRWGAASPVGSFPPDSWGVFDLVGNAAEWVQDVFHGTFVGAPRDGRAWEQETGPISERQRVVRGGSFLGLPAKQRVSNRTGRKPDATHRGTGFRCAADW
ncbi:MAG: formylglycine-generating enzyme family protein [Thermoanaerobaculales bacterium]